MTKGTVQDKILLYYSVYDAIIVALQTIGCLKANSYYANRQFLIDKSIDIFFKIKTKYIWTRVLGN